MAGDNSGGGLGSIVRQLATVSEAARGAKGDINEARREMDGAAEAAEAVTRSSSAATQATRELARDVDGVGPQLDAFGDKVERAHGQIRGITADDVGLGALDDLLRAGAIDLSIFSTTLIGARVHVDGMVQTLASFFADRLPGYKQALGELIGDIARGKLSLEELEQSLRDRESFLTDTLADMVAQLAAGEISAARFNGLVDELRKKYKSGDIAALLDQLEQVGQQVAGGLATLLDEGRLDGSL